MATAGIVIIGDEILAGTFAEENAAWLTRELRTLGVGLRRVSIIPDDAEEIAETVAGFAARFDHVFTSGGVGPTHDDLTIAAIARGFGVAVERHPALEAKVRAYWGDRLAPANLRLADVPAGAELIYGDDPTWPAVRVRNVFVFPGVPALFRRKVAQVRHLLAGVALAEARVFATCDEGELAPDLDAVVAAFPDVKFGSYPRFDERSYRVMVTVAGPVAERVAVAAAALRARLEGRTAPASDAPPTGTPPT